MSTPTTAAAAAHVDARVAAAVPSATHKPATTATDDSPTRTSEEPSIASRPHSQLPPAVAAARKSASASAAPTMFPLSRAALLGASAAASDAARGNGGDTSGSDDDDNDSGNGDDGSDGDERRRVFSSQSESPARAAAREVSAPAAVPASTSDANAPSDAADAAEDSDRRVFSRSASPVRASAAERSRRSSAGASRSAAGDENDNAAGPAESASQTQAETQQTETQPSQPNDTVGTQTQASMQVAEATAALAANVARKEAGGVRMPTFRPVKPSASALLEKINARHAQVRAALSGAALRRAGAMAFDAFDNELDEDDSAGGAGDGLVIVMPTGNAATRRDLRTQLQLRVKRERVAQFEALQEHLREDEEQTDEGAVVGAAAAAAARAARVANAETADAGAGSSPLREPNLDDDDDDADGGGDESSADSSFRADSDLDATGLDELIELGLIDRDDENGSDRDSDRGSGDDDGDDDDDDDEGDGGGDGEAGNAGGQKSASAAETTGAGAGDDGAGNGNADAKNAGHDSDADGAGSKAVACAHAAVQPSQTEAETQELSQTQLVDGSAAENTATAPATAVPQRPVPAGGRRFLDVEAEDEDDPEGLNRGDEEDDEKDADGVLADLVDDRDVVDGRDGVHNKLHFAWMQDEERTAIDKLKSIAAGEARRNRPVDLSDDEDDDAGAVQKAKRREMMEIYAAEKRLGERALREAQERAMRGETGGEGAAADAAKGDGDDDDDLFSSNNTMHSSLHLQQSTVMNILRKYRQELGADETRSQAGDAGPRGRKRAAGGGGAAGAAGDDSNSAHDALSSSLNAWLEDSNPGLHRMLQRTRSSNSQAAALGSSDAGAAASVAALAAAGAATGKAATTFSNLGGAVRPMAAPLSAGAATSAIGATSYEHVWRGALASNTSTVSAPGVLGRVPSSGGAGVGVLKRPLVPGFATADAARRKKMASVCATSDSRSVLFQVASSNSNLGSGSTSASGGGATGAAAAPAAANGFARLMPGKLSSSAAGAGSGASSSSKPGTGRR